MPLKPLASSADIDAMVARMAPVILALLEDGVPRGKRTIVAHSDIFRRARRSGTSPKAKVLRRVASKMTGNENTGFD